MSDRDYYEILGLTPRADGQMVDQAYWHLVRKYQALAATNSRAQRMMDELNEAYGVLGNPRLREQYDAFRDDVLIRSGMLKPVASKPKRDKRTKQEAAPKPARNWSLPSFANAKMYAVSVVIALLAFGAAWQGVNVVLVALLLAAGLGVALAPALGRRISEFSLEMPQVAVPEIKAPKLSLPNIDVPSLRDVAPTGQDGVDADTLRQSTAETIARWRRSVGLKVAPEDPDVDEPEANGTTGVEAPFDTVMDILRGSGRRTVSGG